MNWKVRLCKAYLIFYPLALLCGLLIGMLGLMGLPERFIGLLPAGFLQIADLMLRVPLGVIVAFPYMIIIVITTYQMIHILDKPSTRRKLQWITLFNIVDLMISVVWLVLNIEPIELKFSMVDSIIGNILLFGELLILWKYDVSKNGFTIHISERKQ